jgi:hypothetical protein
MEYIKYFDKFKDMDSYLYIDEKEWTYIKDNFDKDDVKLSLAKIAMTYEPPYQEISINKARKSFNKLKGVNWRELILEGEWFARAADGYTVPLVYNDKPLYFKRHNIGNESSNYFQQKNRWIPDAAAYPGPSRTWKTEKFMVTLMGAAYSLKVSKINRSILRTMLSLRKYICSQFKPSVAKSLYDMFESKNVLDFSAGWGDRLAGFYAANTTEFYLGIDPRTENHPLYEEQAKYYSEQLGFFDKKKTSKFLEVPAEDADLNEYSGFMDIVFTSPPYFNIERYSTDETQSWVRHKSIDDWNELFLHKALDNVWTTLKKGGHLIVNISDVYTNHKWSNQREWLKICDPMIEYMKTHLNSEFIGVIGMEMAKRPNCAGIGNKVTEDDNMDEFETEVVEKQYVGTFCEPMWIWRKK